MSGGEGGQRPIPHDPATTPAEVSAASAAAAAAVMCFLLARSAAFDVAPSVQGGQRGRGPPPADGERGGAVNQAHLSAAGGGGALCFRSAGRRKLSRLAFPHFLLRPLLVGVQECSGRGGRARGGGEGGSFLSTFPDSKKSARQRRREDRRSGEVGWRVNRGGGLAAAINVSRILSESLISEKELR